MNLQELPVNDQVREALEALEKRELAKVTRLQAVLDGNEFTLELATQLIEARDQLQTDPALIYTLIGELLAQDPAAVSYIFDFIAAIAALEGTQDAINYTKYELLVRREADNKIAELIFKLLMKAKTITTR